MDIEVNYRIYNYRKKYGYTQAQLGKMLGLKTSTYSQMERKGNIDTDILKKLAEIFNVSVISLSKKHKKIFKRSVCTERFYIYFLSCAIGKPTILK